METKRVKGVMDASIEELKQICKEHLLNYDNLQQEFSNLGDMELAIEFVKAYDELEAIYFNLKKTGKIKDSERNRLRMKLKHYLKLDSITNKNEQLAT